MTYPEVMAELKKLGTAQAVKIYRRHGAVGECYGVSFANFGVLKKKLKTDHALARQLWDSGVLDARVLATMIADPQQADATLLEKWIGDITDYGLAGLLGGFAAHSAAGRKLALKWAKHKAEYVQATGWYALSAAAKLGEDGLSTKQCEALVADIEKRIHKVPNRARYAMNWALIALGGYRSDVRESALDAAKRIGHVEIDHGETGCKTPDAVSYIKKMAVRAKPTKH